MTCLNSKWEVLAASFQTSAETKNMTVEDIFGKLTSCAGIRKRKAAIKPVKERNVALMVEKALKKMVDDDDDEEEEDEDVALVTKTIRNFWKKSELREEQLQFQDELLQLHMLSLSGERSLRKEVSQEDWRLIRKGGNTRPS